VTQQASHNIPGYSYSVTNGGNTPLEQDKPGLVVNLSPDDATLLYSTIDNSGVSLYIKNMTTGASTRLYIETLANKCIWGSDSVTLYCAVPNSLPQNLPESWYKGKTHFADNILRVDTTTGDSDELSYNTGLDIVDLHIVDDTLVFKNKIDQSLWALTKD
jgi:hypothetical protein